MLRDDCSANRCILMINIFHGLRSNLSGVDRIRPIWKLMPHRISHVHAAVHGNRNGLTAVRENRAREVVAAALNIRQHHMVDQSMHVHAVTLAVLRTSLGLDREAVPRSQLRAVQVAQKNLHRVVAAALRIPNGHEAVLVIRVALEAGVIPVLAQRLVPKNANVPY